MSYRTQGELLALVSRVRDEAVILLEALYERYPELRTCDDEVGVKGWFPGESPYDVIGGLDDESQWLKAQREYYRGKTTAESTGGSFASYPAEAHLLKLLEVNTHLSVQNQREYAESISRVVANMPPAARRAIVQEVQGIVAFDSMEELRVFTSDFYGEKDSTTKGVWDPSFKFLVLDGGSEGVLDENYPYRHAIRDGLYAHELTHAIDTSHQPHISDTPEWKAAHKEEFKKVYSGISERAKEYPREAFAEMGRLLYSGRHIAHNTEFCKEYMPKCYAIFNQRRLAMKKQVKSIDQINDELKNLVSTLTDEELMHMTPERLLELSPNQAANRARCRILKLTDDEIRGWLEGPRLYPDNSETGTFDETTPIDAKTGSDTAPPEASKQ